MGNSSSSQSAANGEPAVPKEPKPPSYYTMIRNSYQTLVNAIIRPPRCQYDISKLGPDRFLFCGRTIVRRDFNLVNPREQRFCCSLWEPIDTDRPNALLPCIVYMHGNSSSRLEALSVLSLALTLGTTLFAFDFAGSGQSDGEYVTLGAFEKDDLQCVMEFLRASGTTSSIALWGRSMGAATALLHGERDPSIAAMVLDSTFSSLVVLAEEIVELGRKQGLFAPGFLVRMALQFVRSSVLKTAGFDIRTLTPIESAAKCFSPAMLIAAEGDHFVSKSHSEAIMERYGGDKNLVLVDGDHNTARPRFLYDSVGIFLQQTLQIPAEWMLPQGEPYIRRLPWSYVPHASHFVPTVTHVGTKHAMQSPPTSPHMDQHRSGSGAAAGNAAPPAVSSSASRDSWGNVASSSGDAADGSTGGRGMNMAEGSTAGGAGAEEMSFDEMLALSMMLNEDEELGSYEQFGGKYAGGYSEDYEYDEADEQYDPLATTVGASAGAERAMQQNVQNSLFNLMSGGGAVDVNVNTPEPPPPSAASKKGQQHNSTSNAKQSTGGGGGRGGQDMHLPEPPTPSKQAQLSASERYRLEHPAQRLAPSGSHTPNPSPGSDRLMTPNETGKNHAPYTPPLPVTRNVVAPHTVTEAVPIDETHATPHYTSPYHTKLPEGTSKTDAVPVKWRCTMCTLDNLAQTDTCESCGIMRSL